jgi:3-phenylpropionate/trans-cinnamate dioxygenase ferredoxin subunit
MAVSDWIDVCAADELRPGELRGLEIGKRLVLLANHAGVVSAIDDFCNHAGCLLSGGWIDGKKGAVVCPCHEYTFDLRTGRNVTFPRLSDDQEAFPTKVEGGRVLLRIGGTGVEDDNAR